MQVSMLKCLHDLLNILHSSMLKSNEAAWLKLVIVLIILLVPWVFRGRQAPASAEPYDIE